MTAITKGAIMGKLEGKKLPEWVVDDEFLNFLAVLHVFRVEHTAAGLERCGHDEPVVDREVETLRHLNGADAGLKAQRRRVGQQYTDTSDGLLDFRPSETQFAPRHA